MLTHHNTHMPVTHTHIPATAKILLYVWYSFRPSSGERVWNLPLLPHPPAHSRLPTSNPHSTIQVSMCGCEGDCGCVKYMCILWCAFCVVNGFAPATIDCWLLMPHPLLIVDNWCPALHWLLTTGTLCRWACEWTWRCPSHWGHWRTRVSND